MTAKPATGFTLIELLIALVLLVIIVVLLFSSLRLGSRTWESVEAFSERLAEIRLTHQFVERALRQIRSVDIVVDAHKRLLFSGQPHSIEWVAPLAEQAGIPGLYILRLTLLEQDGRQQLLFTYWLLHPDSFEGQGDIPAWQPLVDDHGSYDGLSTAEPYLGHGLYGQQVLLKEVDEFTLAYFGRVQGDQSAAWHDTWVEQRELPLRIRLQMNTVAQYWPMTVIPMPGSAVYNE
jgi:general secretion pathway protein J